MYMACMPYFEAIIRINLTMELLLGILFFVFLVLLGWLAMQWSEYKKLQRAVSIANKASGFIKELTGKEANLKTIEMREVIETLDDASRRGGNSLAKGSTEL